MTTEILPLIFKIINSRRSGPIIEELDIFLLFRTRVVHFRQWHTAAAAATTCGGVEVSACFEDS